MNVVFNQTNIMKTFISLKTATKFAFLLVIISLFFFACKKTSDVAAPIDPVITVTPPDLTTKINSSVSGFVTDGNNVAVKDASVLLGTTTVLTDKYGFFEARNVQMVQNAAVVTVSKTGFFKGIKTYIATANKSAFLRIKLMPKASAGTVNATAGGVVTLVSGLSINFPASAIVNASTNAAYTGTVTVAAFYINPMATDLNSIMPGDLRGLNTDGELKLLTTYGMAAVELTGAGGELLQIATGKKAVLTMPISTALSASAPAIIPLWYFNETNGLWKQEGSATKNGNTYVGDVSHFSFWNCDVPNNYVQFNCTVVNTAGQPVQNAYVKISLVSNPLNATYGYTDSSGYVSGAVPNNALLKLDVFGSVNCSTAAFSQTFTTTNVNVAYGNVSISTAANIATLVGSVKNCAGAPVTNGYLIVQYGNANSRIQLSNTGTYSINRLVCSFPTTITLVGEDAGALQQSTPISYIVSAAGVNNIPIINACGVTTQQFINYTINGAPYSFTPPADTLYYSNNLQSIIQIEANRLTSPFSNLKFSFSNTAIAVGSSLNLFKFNPSQIIDTISINTPINVNITEYGAVGQFTAGNFTGALNGRPPANTIYNITCNFRIRRNN